MRLILALFLTSTLFGVQVVSHGPIHEAILQEEITQVVLQAIPLHPPADIVEKKTEKPDRKMVWIPGYWSWDREHGKFLWVSGVWRKPPKGKRWEPGLWEEVEQGFVWLCGFWGEAEPIVFFKQAPPDPVDLGVPKPQKEGYFWAPGYWAHEDGYVWVEGRFEVIRPKRIYMPSRYLWRKDGYHFVPGYWDYPLEERGTLFAAADIPLDARSTIKYTPSVQLKPLYVVEGLFPYYPSYACFFQTHFETHRQRWEKWGAAPDWWNWALWWTFVPENQLALFWWWSHPPYPHPEWITEAIAEKITPPASFVLNMMQTVTPPVTVGKTGVVSQNQLLDALHVLNMADGPILPADAKQLQKVQNVAQTKTVSLMPLRPSAKSAPKEPLPKPKLKTSRAELENHPKLMRMPHVAHRTVPRNPNPPQGTMLDEPYPPMPFQGEPRDEMMGNPQPQVNPPGPKVHPLPGDEAHTGVPETYDDR